MSEITQWRACGRDDDEDHGSAFERTAWGSEAGARELLAREFTNADPAYDEVWLERRTVTYGEPERVE